MTADAHGLKRLWPTPRKWTVAECLCGWTTASHLTETGAKIELDYHVEEATK